MKDHKTELERKYHASDILSLVGSGVSLLGLATAVATSLGASPSLLISGASILASLFAGIYAKDVAQTLRKLSGAKRVFLSYSAQYEETANELANALRLNGIKVWTARERVKVGESITDAVENALDDADTFVVFIGQEPTKSVLHEIGLAKARKIKIIPFLLQPGQLPADLQGIKFIDLAHGKEQALREVVEATTQ